MSFHGTLLSIRWFAQRGEEHNLFFPFCQPILSLRNFLGQNVIARWRRTLTESGVAPISSRSSCSCYRPIRRYLREEKKMIMNHYISLKSRFALQEAIEQFSTHLISPIEWHCEFFEVREFPKGFSSPKYRLISTLLPPFSFPQFLSASLFVFPNVYSTTPVNAICIVHRFRWKYLNSHSMEKNKKKKTTLLPSATAGCDGGDISPSPVLAQGQEDLIAISKRCGFYLEV